MVCKFLTRALDVMADAKGAFRSKRVTIAQGDDLSSINKGSGFEVPRRRGRQLVHLGRADRVRVPLPRIAGVLRLFRSVAPTSAAGIPACFGDDTFVELRFIGVVGVLAHHAVDDVRVGPDQDAEPVGPDTVQDSSPPRPRWSAPR
jgi:hypothetical protein